MIDNIDKRDRAQEFRDRLAQAMAHAKLSQSALARQIGVDRSTLSQALNADGPRLPGAQIVAACAGVLGVSADWLLSLSDRPESAAELLATSMAMTEAPRALIDEQIFAWHREAAGYKIRHVPAGLPDMLKTDDFLRWEYGDHLGRTATQAINASHDRLNWMRASPSDYEIAMPVHEVHALASAAGYYAGVPDPIRAAQLEQMKLLAYQLYPRLRVYLFDAHQLYSAPISIFGPLLSVIYVGGHFMTFRSRDRVDVMTQHFDDLVRQALVPARDFPDYLTGL